MPGPSASANQIALHRESSKHTMTLLTLLAYVAIGAALACVCVTLLRRTRRRNLYCIAPYVPARQRNALPPPKP